MNEIEVGAMFMTSTRQYAMLIMDINKPSPILDKGVIYYICYYKDYSFKDPETIGYYLLEEYLKQGHIVPADEEWINRILAFRV